MTGSGLPIAPQPRMRDGVYAVRVRRCGFVDLDGREFRPPQGFKGAVQTKGKWYWSKDEITGR